MSSITSSSPLAPPVGTAGKPAFTWWTAVVAATLLLAHTPMLWAYGASLLRLPHYEFAVLLPIAAVILAWPRVKNAGRLTAGTADVYLPLVGFAMATMAASVVFDSPWFGAVSALLAILAVIYGIGGAPLLHRLWPVWAFLWLGVRFPLNMDVRLTQWLQHYAAQSASYALSRFHVLHVLEGNIVEVPGRQFGVDQACSGIQSLFAITACTLFFCIWNGRPVLRSLALLMAAWFWVWMANVGRVFGVTVLSTYWDLPVDKGLGHDIFGVVLFAITIGLIISTDRLFLFLIPEGLFSGGGERLDRETSHGLFPNQGTTRLPSFGSTWVAFWPVVAIYLVLGLGQWMPFLMVRPPTPLPVAMESLHEEVLPRQLGNWNRVGYELTEREGTSQWGEYSQIWQYEKGHLKAVVSVDYPFFGWHELTTCYTSDGWWLTERDVVESPAEGPARDPRGRCVTATVAKEALGSHGFLVFTIFDDRLEPVPAPGALSPLHKLIDRVNNFLLRVRTMGAAGNAARDDVQSFQIQWFTHSFAPITQADRDEIVQLFSEVRERLQAHMPGAGDQN